jgi:hypothetical protein
MARRGLPDTPEAGMWMSLQPGIEVVDINKNTIEVRYERRH